MDEDKYNEQITSTLKAIHALFNRRTQKSTDPSMIWRKSKPKQPRICWNMPLSPIPSQGIGPTWQRSEPLSSVSKPVFPQNPPSSPIFEPRCHVNVPLSPVREQIYLSCVRIFHDPGPALPNSAIKWPASAHDFQRNVPSWRAPERSSQIYAPHWLRGGHIWPSFAPGWRSLP